MRFASLLLLSALLTTPAVACPDMGMGLEPVTADGDTIMPDGGVLLRAVAGFHQAQRAFALEDANGAIDTTTDPLAPGLVRLTPKKHVTGDLSLVGGRARLTIHDAAATTALAAPTKAKVFSTYSRKSKPTRSGFPMTETTTVMLTAPAPADVYGIILYGPDKQPRAFMPPQADRTTFMISFGGKGCGSVGASGAIVGESVTLAFVDRAGRVTARSKTIRVAVTK